MYKKIIIIIISLIILITGYLILSNTEKSPELIVNDQNVSLFVGDEYTIKYVFNNQGNTILEWNVDNDNISIENGKVKALKDGKSIVTVSYKYKDSVVKKDIIFTIDKKDKEAPVIEIKTSIDENKWYSNDVVIQLNVIDSSNVVVTYTNNCSDKCEKTNIDNNELVVSNEGTNKIIIEATDDSNNSSTKAITVKIDKTVPTCNLTLNNAKIKAEVNDTNIEYYGIDSNYTGDNITSFAAKVGVNNYYVKDMAGNTGTCSIKIDKKIQYASRTCNTCGNCKDAGCSKYTEWHTTGNHCNNKTSSADYIGEYEKYTNCHLDSSCSSNIDTGNKERPDKKYMCTRAIRSCEKYKESCDKCGCSSWSEYGKWQDEKITPSSTVEVKTKSVLYSE